MFRSSLSKTAVVDTPVSVINAVSSLFNTSRRFSSTSPLFTSSVATSGAAAVRRGGCLAASRNVERAMLFGSQHRVNATVARASSNQFSAAGVLATARRFQSQQASQDANQQQQQNSEGAENNKDGKTGAGAGEGKKGGAAAGEDEAKAGGFRAQWEGIKRDMVEFPDIYNGPNMLSVAFFTIFCLSSTGTQVEANWWLDHWAVDQDSHLRPWSWALHSVHMNNFLSMVFAILLLHNSLHPLTHGLAGGAKALMQYCALVSVLSGVSIWAFQKAWYDGSKDVQTGRPIRGEKQFGPWDIASAVMVMQYLRLGIPPHRLLLSFNGWVKYACCVGAVCILYYDPQPVVFGTIFGFLLCRFAPLFRGVATV